MTTALRWTAAFVLAALTTTLLGTVLQTQFNLAALNDFGLPMPFPLRIEVTLRDLLGFGPLFGALSAAGLLIAFLVTGVLRRWLVRGRAALYALAGAVAVVSILLLMQAALGLVVIAAARGAFGFAVLVACGAAGGWVFARMTVSQQ